MAARAALGSLVLLVLVLGAAPAAHAYKTTGPRWPGEITYASQAPRYDGAIKRAVRLWNAAKAGVRFRRVPAPAARVVFRYAPGRGSGATRCAGIAGEANVGYPGTVAERSVISVGRSCRSADLRALTAAHELGHVLGLGHEDRRCALMNSAARSSTRLGSHCGRRSTARSRSLRRRLVLSDDVRGARALYRRAFVRDDADAMFNPGVPSTIALEAGPVQFSAARPNALLTYRWDFGDPASGAANSAAGQRPVHAFTGAGTYSITLSVRDAGALMARRIQPLTLFCTFC